MSYAKFSAKNFRRLIMFIFKGLVAIVPSLLFLSILLNYIPVPYYSRGNWLGIFFYMLLFIVITIPYKSFDIGISRKGSLKLSYTISLIIVNVFTYIVLCLISRAILNPLPMIVLTIVQIIVGYLLYDIADRVYHSIYPSRQTVIIYSDSEYDINVAHKFGGREDRYTIKSIITESEGYDAIVAEIDKYPTVIIGSLELNNRQRIFEYAYERKKRIFLIPSVEDVIMRSSEITQIGDSVAHLVKDRTMSLEQLAIKRLFDIAFSGLFLLLTSPITLITALIIKMYDRGPVFFKQKRLTRNNEIFEILKFRSMGVDAEKDGAQFTTENDERITPIGKFIRRTRIDEIPQFINVLKGDMSVVGPRAERVENYDLYSKETPKFYYRTRVKAGITGHAQIYGRYNTNPEDKVRMDVYYIENFSFWNDIKLILSTVKVVFEAHATEGFENKTITESTKIDTQSSDAGSRKWED